MKNKILLHFLVYFLLALSSSLFSLSSLLAESFVTKQTQSPSSSPGGRAVASPQQKTSSSQEQLPEVVIKGGDKSGLQSEKPELEIDLDPDEPLYPVLEAEGDILRRQPDSMKDNSQIGFQKSLFSNRPLLPARVRLARDPAKILYPLREIMAISPSLSQEIGVGWEVTIIDGDGRSFRKFSGKGLPPGNIQWNGRGDKGEISLVGRTYSPVIGYKDMRGQKRNLVGEPFSFDGIIHQESKGLIISLAPSSIFEIKKGFAEDGTIKGSGLDLLQESADWIKRYYFTYPIQIECYSPDTELAASRARFVAKALGKLLLLTRGEIPANGILSDRNGERIDILITNR